MNRYVILIFALCGLADARSTGRIVGGQTAQEGQFPYQVSLRANGNHFCGGSIVNEYWIVTAAHCLYGNNNAITVVTGTNSLSQGGDAYRAVAGYYHGDFNPSQLVNDVAMIKVGNPIRFNSRVQAISLNTANIGAGAQLVLSGWGLTSYPGSIPDRLQYAYLMSISTQDCSNSWQTQISNSQICTFTHVGQGACQGDSGGPLAYGGQLAGIVSFGQPCAVGAPDVFTRVSSFVNWIQAVIQQG